MPRWLFLAALICGAVGCRAPMPEMNLLAPYGTPRIPPPATGVYGSPSTYYQPGSQAPAQYQNPQYQTPQFQPSQPAIGTGVKVQPQGATRWTQTGTSSAESGGSRNELRTARTNNGVHTASFESDVESADSERPMSERARPTVRIRNNSDIESNTQPRLRGMPVNDATKPREPARFQPPADAIDISQLPRPDTSVQLVSTDSILGSTGRTASVASASYDAPVLARTQATATGGWQSRPLGQSAPRFAGR